MASQQKDSNNDKKQVTGDRIVFPGDKDEKADLAEAAVEIKSNSIEESKASTGKIVLTNRNFIQTPPNCPPGQQPDKDGVCRDVF
ncbi:unnamed protein product [Danaus chrysippus]|uniref:(African queen) hypothetical protein n=1 Tax=Danaus chrysippus TaxID=151541 RepID=A0A8J2WDI0_9NEOP|nr:unnamed protein product [Danaus chrysippus]